MTGPHRLWVVSVDGRSGRTGHWKVVEAYLRVSMEFESWKRRAE